MGEQLEIERKALDEQERHDIVHHSPAEDLEPDLGIADVEPEENAVQLLVAPARDPARARVMDDRVRMPLRANREVEALALGNLEVVGHR